MSAGLSHNDRLIRRTTTICVLLLAAIAALVSYAHMLELALRHGEPTWTAALIPLSVDGMILASSMSLLLDSRTGNCGGVLPWTLLVIGCSASLGANVAIAEPTLYGRLIAAWPSFALIGAYELLMTQIRHIARTDARPSPAASTAPQPAMNALTADNGSANHANGQPIQADTDRPANSRALELQRQAWQWAQSHRSPDGALPPGRLIGQQFSRTDRWGRLIKRSGTAGHLG